MSTASSFCLSIILSIILFCVPLTVASQTGSARPPTTDAELFDLLLTISSPTEARPILSQHKELITPQLWSRLVGESERVYRARDYTAARRLYGIAAESAAAINNQTRLGWSLAQIGLTYYAAGDIPKATDCYTESARILEQAGERRYLLATLFQLGVAYYTTAYQTTAQFAQAREAFERALTLAREFRDAEKEARTLYYLGLIASFENNLKQALAYLEPSRRIAADNDLSQIESETLIEEGGVHRQRGDFRQALTATVRGIELLRSRKLEKKLPHALIRLGILYADQGDFAKAVATLTEGLETARRTGNDHDAAFALLNLAATNKEAGDFSAALKYYTESLQVAEARGIHQTLTAAALGGLGGLQQLVGNYAEAEKTLRKGLAVSDQSGARLRATVITWQLADLSLAQRRPAQAAELAARAAARAAEIEFPALVSLALTTGGRAQVALGDNRRAEGLLRQAVELVEQLRAHVAGGATEYQKFFDRQLTPHHLLVQLLLSQNRPEEALLFAERAKGRALLDALRAERRDEFDGLTERQRADEADLRRRIIALNLRLSTTEPHDAATLERLRRELQEARLRYESFRLLIAAGATGDRARAAAGGGMRSTSDLVPLLNGGRTALLEYVLTGDKVTLFVVTRDASAGAPAPYKIRTYPLAAEGEELARVVAGFRQDVSDPSSAFKARARQLYRLLLEPAAAQLADATTLCIVPQGVFWDVPFQALLSPDGKYVIEERAVYYAPSFGVLLAAAQRQQTSSRRGGRVLLAVGNPSAGAGTALPDAEVEVSKVGALNPSSIILTGRDATEHRVKAEVSDKRVIHLATHGVLDDQQPIYSHLKLAPSAGEDGLLEAWEIADLRLSADLVILSACDTARGKISNGEGVIGIAWAFQLAGCPTVIVSRWPVDSAGTAELMIGFHRQLNGPQTSTAKAEVWREAARRLLTDGKYKHPFYWAGFSLVGAGD